MVIDTLSRWPEVAVVTSTGFDKVQLSLEKVFALHGAPETVTTDNGPPYDGKDWESYSKQWGFTHLPVSPEHPEGNGIAERFMATIVKTVHVAMAEHKDPKVEIERRLLQYRNTPHPSTGQTPSFMMFNMMNNTQ